MIPFVLIIITIAILDDYLPDPIVALIVIALIVLIAFPRLIGEGLKDVLSIRNNDYETYARNGTPSSRWTGRMKCDSCDHVWRPRYEVPEQQCEKCSSRFVKQVLRDK